MPDHRARTDPGPAGGHVEDVEEASRPEVLHVITRMARGGSERRLLDAVRAVDAHHVVVVGPGSDEAVVAALAASAEVLRCDHLVRHLDPRRDLVALGWLARLVRRRGVAVVHTHQSKAGLLGRVAARAHRGTVVVHSASMASFGPGYGRAASLAFAVAERLTAPLVDRFVVVGSDLARRLAANGVPRARLTVVRSSLELGAFHRAEPSERRALRERFGVGDAGAVVAFVGSLDERKGVHRLATLLRRALGPGASPAGRTALLVAGDGPLRERLATDLAAVPDVHPALLGHVDDVASVLRASDLLVLPSSAEGLPQVVVQAAAAGVPVVAYDVDGVREVALLGARTAIVPFGDEAAFADALRGGLHRATTSQRHPGDDACVPDDVLEAWSPHRVEAQYRQVYRELLGGRGLSGRRGASARWGSCAAGSPAR